MLRPARAAGPERPAWGDTMPKTLLLADDSVTIQKVVGISFANEDIVLLTVDNGDDAIARAKEARPDVILADVVMPGKNGYEVCQAVKSDPTLASTPVLLLTGTFEAFDEQRAARAGADGHITKPFEAQSLVDKVNALLAGREAPAAAAPAAPARVEIGVLRPARVEVPAPTPSSAPVSHTADTAYDFFDDEVTAPRPGASAREDATVLRGAEPPPAASPYDFDVEDGGAEPQAAPFAAPPFAPADPATTTVVEAAPALDDWSAPVASAAGRETTPRFGDDDLGFQTSLAAPAEDGDRSLFDGGFPASADEPPSPDPGRETRLLGDSFDAPDDAFDPGTTRVADAFDALGAPSAAGPSAGTFDTGDDPEPYAFDPAATRLAEAARPAQAPLDALDELELEGGLDAGDPFGEAVFDPTGARDYDVSSSDLGAPLTAAPLPRETLLEPVPAAWSSAWESEPAPAARPEPAAAAAFASPAPAALDAAASSTALGRDELRDMLEKMAWEAFGPLTERLVRDAVERIERVAWEVIPQLAETLIREEIRKLKGD